MCKIPTKRQIYRRKRIESKIAEIRNDLPAGVQITVEKMNPSILPVIGYTLETNNNNSRDYDFWLGFSEVVPVPCSIGSTSEVLVRRHTRYVTDYSSLTLLRWSFN